MDFNYVSDDTLDEFAREVREWLEAEATVPELARRAQSLEDSQASYRARRELGRKLGERGWLYPSAPTEYGGGGMDAAHTLVLFREMQAFGLGLPPYYDTGGIYGAPVMLRWGTEEQKRAFLPPIYTGQVRTWQLLTESGAGSDLAGVRMTAIRDGNRFRLNGEKVFVGSAHGAERYCVLAVTDRERPRHQNLGWFYIDAGLPGIEVQPIELLSGSSEGESDAVGIKNIVHFTDVMVPEECLVGGENNGWAVSNTHLEGEHSGIGRHAFFAGDPLWQAVLRQVATTIDPDDPAEEGTLERVAEIYLRTEVVRLLTLRNAWYALGGGHSTYEGSQVTYLRKVHGLANATSIVDLLGPLALVADGGPEIEGGIVESRHRDAIIAMHPGGTADIQKLIIARRLGVGKAD